MAVASSSARRILTSKICKSKNLTALEKLFHHHGNDMDRMHLSALLHRSGQVVHRSKPMKQRKFEVPWLKEVIQRLTLPFSSREVASGLWASAKLMAKDEARSWLKELPPPKEQWKAQEFFGLNKKWVLGSASNRIRGPPCRLELSNTLWALATLSLEEEPWCSTLTEWSAQDVVKMEGQHLANISWALATFNHTTLEDSCARWFAALHVEMLRRRCDGEKHFFEPRHLANIFWAMSKLGVRSSLLHLMAEDLSMPGALAEFQSRDLAAVVRAYASLEVLHENLFRSVALAAQKTGMSSFSSQDLQNLSWAYALALRFGLFLEDADPFRSVAKLSLQVGHWFLESVGNIWSYNPYKLLYGDISPLKVEL
eukprot:symbB.v1.2.000264.t1/scaffold20.1/size571870/9